MNTEQHIEQIDLLKMRQMPEANKSSPNLNSSWFVLVIGVVI
jgi:hypothetical protein